VLPEVPVIVMFELPAVAEALAVRVRVLPLNAAVTPLGKPDATYVTVPLKPFTSVTVMASVPLAPWAMDRVAAEGAMVKLAVPPPMTTVPVLLFDAATFSAVSVPVDDRYPIPLIFNDSAFG